MTTETMAGETNRAQVVDCEALVSVLRLGVEEKSTKLMDAELSDARRQEIEADLIFTQELLTAAAVDLNYARAALDAVPQFIDDEKTALRLVLVHSAEPAAETVAEHAKPDDDARAWCGTLLDQHTSKCVDCHDRMLERAVLAMGGSDNSVFRMDTNGQPSKSYLYLPNAAMVTAGFVCTWNARSSLTAALLDYIRGHRDWNNRMLGEVQS